LPVLLSSTGLKLISPVNKLPEGDLTKYEKNLKR